MRALTAVRFLLAGSVTAAVAPAASGQDSPPTCPNASMTAFDLARTSSLVGTWRVALVDTSGSQPVIRHRGTLTLWLQDTRPERRGVTAKPGERLLAGAWDAEPPDTGSTWRAMTGRDHASPGAVWSDGFLRLGELGAGLGLSLYFTRSSARELRGTWNNGSGMGVMVDFTGDRPREHAGYFCATRAP